MKIFFFLLLIKEDFLVIKEDFLNIRKIVMALQYDVPLVILGYKGIF